MARNITIGKGLVLARLSTNTLVEAAAQLGCSERTVRRRLKDADVIALMDEARWEQVDLGMAHIMNEFPNMVKVLADAAKDETLDIRVRCAQAYRVVELGIRAATLYDYRMKQEDA